MKKISARLVKVRKSIKKRKLLMLKLIKAPQTGRLMFSMEKAMNFLVLRPEMLL
jgi:hypothetical protein